MKEMTFLASMKLTLDYLVTILMLAFVGACIGYCVGSTIDAVRGYFRGSNVQ